MLKLIFITISFIALNKIYGQESKLIRPQEINSNIVTSSIASPGNTVITNAVTKTYLVKNEEYYTKFIAALEGKKAHIQADSTLNKKAISIGWYIKINNELEKAEKELIKLNRNEK